MRAPEEIAERFATGLVGESDPAIADRWMLVQTIANAVKEAQKPLMVALEYAQGLHDDCEMPTTDPRESALFYATKNIIGMLKGEIN